MEKYTRVPVARETDREDFESVFVCVFEEEPPPPISTGNGKGQREKKSMTKEHGEHAYEMALTAHHKLNKGFCVHPPKTRVNAVSDLPPEHHLTFLFSLF